MTAPGYTVSSDVLVTFATGLDGTAQGVRAASARTGAANSFNFEAFGFLLGQVLAAPTRIALRAVQDKITGAAEGVEDDARELRATADRYRDTEEINADGLTPAG